MFQPTKTFLWQMRQVCMDRLDPGPHQIKITASHIVTLRRRAGKHQTTRRSAQEYQRIRELTVHVLRYGKQILFTNAPQPITPVFAPDESMTLASIVSAVRDALANLPKIESLPKAIVKKVISLEEMVSTLTDRIKSALKMNFKEFTRGATENKVEVIVGFLALLELVKQGVVRVTQESHKEDIVIESDALGVPRY